MSKHKVDDIFRNAFPQQHFTNSDAGWEKAAAMLDAQAPAGAGASALWKFGSIAIAAICSIGLVWWFSLTDKTQYSPQKFTQSPVDFEPLAWSNNVFDNQGSATEKSQNNTNSPLAKVHNADEPEALTNGDAAIKTAISGGIAKVKRAEIAAEKRQKNNSTTNAMPRQAPIRNEALGESQSGFKENRTLFEGEALAYSGQVGQLPQMEMPSAMVMDLSQSKGNKKSTYYKRWHHSIYGLGGALFVPTIVTSEENAHSASKTDVSSYNLQIGLGWYAQRNQFRFGVGAQHSSIRRKSSFEAMLLRDTVYQTIDTRNEITGIDSTYNGLVWDTTGPIDKFIEDWSVDTSYQEISDTTNTPGVDTSFNTQSTHIVQAYVEIPVFFGYVISKGRFQYSIQGGYSLGYLYRQRITGSFSEIIAVQNSYDIEQRLTHSVFFNPEVSFMLSDRASIFAQPTVAYRLSGGTPKIFKPTSMGLRFGLAYHF